MRYVIQVIKEQLLNIHLIFRLASFDLKSTYQMHYLGMIWQLLNPAIQIAAYWFVFGIGIRGGQPIGDIPFFVWLFVGLVPWFFIAPSITQGSNSIFSKVNLVSKMKFPVSVLPTIIIVKNAYNFFMMSIILIFILIINKVSPGIYLLQLPYYLFSLFAFLFSLTLFCSTISVMIRDFQTMLGSVMRLLFFLTPILWDASRLNNHLLTVLKLNPFYYLINGFRNTLLFNTWFFEDIGLTFYFWSITLLILFIGAYIHIKFRDKFVDYL
ncbi:ABC transporter permease [Bacillus sp. FJAT-49732]|uniref:Transport permease protein n=1 Tax=Lederbergia citrisecunda TaxID=2833583 RepID=A0A942YNT7_9BACI|nr:ABC transporter permease [Lederbergia citrisecunda]MBS4200631.1 ABC transporter permease [Lederbergia citrisecunda]